MTEKNKKLNDDMAEKVSGGYWSYDTDALGNYICPTCSGVVDHISLVCSQCGTSYGQATVDETRKFE